MQRFYIMPIVVATLLGSSSANAQLTINGAVGLPLNPTAQIAEEDSTQVQSSFSDLAKFNYVDFINQPPFAENEGSDLRFYGLHAAKGLSKRLEVSGGIEKLDGPRRTINTVTQVTELVDGVFISRLVITPAARVDYNRTGLAFGAKYLLLGQNNQSKPQVAIGIGYSRARFNNLYGYVVGSKSFGNNNGRAPVRAHLGARYDRFNYDFITTVLDPTKFFATLERSKKLSIYGGVEVPLTRHGDVTFVGELQSKNTDLAYNKSPYSASIRYNAPNSGFTASLGLQSQGIIFGDRGRLFGQIGYAFGGGEK